MKVSYGNSRKAKHWNNGEIAEDELRARLKNTFRTPETVLEYAKLRGEARSDAKDKGGFVGGFLKDGIRRKENVEFRSMLTLDADSPSLTFLEEYESLCPYHTMIYSTHSHTAAAPRYRLVVFLTRDISPDEYQAITRLYTAEWGIEQFDPCSYLPTQLMFWPTTPKDGEYIFREVEGKALDPDTFLSKYPSWKDPASLPISSKETELVKKQQKKAEDPLEKKGIIGAFCKAFSIEDVIERFLGDIYEPSSEPNKYRLKSSASAAGLVVYNHKFAYSHHATDPAYGQECNAFDLVRIHLFPEDGDAKKSFQKMSDFASQQPEVGRILLSERQAAAREAFSDDGDDDSADWTDSLTRDRSGNIRNTLQNLVLIMEHDKEMRKIRFNQLADNMEADEDIAWADKREGPFWRDADDAQLICYVDKNYGTFTSRNYEIAVTKVVDDRSYHPIKQYLERLPAWDQKPRVDRLLIDYLGAEDSPYVRAVTRKTLCAAVSRIYHPGIKFDSMPVLNGDQGIGKSTLIAKLGMDWFADSLTLSDMNDKTAAEKLQGYWIHEIGELAGMKKADIDKVKAFISRQDDKYRASFGRRVTPHPRQCVFFGTTNSENGYLRDITGNRRFWNVVVTGNGPHHPWELTQSDIDQIWAEVLVLVAAGEKLYLPADLESEARKEQNAAMEKDDREGVVRLYLEKLLPEGWEAMDIYQRRDFLRGDDPTAPEGTVQRTSVSNMEIWCECFGRNKEDLKPSDSYAISSIMSRIEGWSRTKRTKTSPLYGRQRIYVKDESLSQGTGNAEQP